MKIGIVGLPNVGKSTLFNALTASKAGSANYPFCTIEPNVGIVAVPDARVDNLSKIYKTRSTVHATIEFVDIAGLVKGASSGEGLGNKFLANIREADAIVHVVRAFESSDIVHVDGSVNPERDINTINLELILADAETVEKRIQKVVKQARSGNADATIELAILERLKQALSLGKSASSVELSLKEREIVKSFALLTRKPVIYCANVGESDIKNDGANNPYVVQIRKIASESGAEVITVCCNVEEALVHIEDSEERAEFSAMYDTSVSGLDKLITASYRLLGLISFLTAGEQEVRAWTITKGTKAPQSAGKIHTDFERGFIKAEVVSYDDFIACGSLANAKTAGKLRSEGKDYVVMDGDIINFKFNV